MSRSEKIFTGNSVEDVSAFFAGIVSRNYLEDLKFWKTTAMDDPEETADLEAQIRTTSDIVYQSSYSKILEMIKQQQKDNQTPPFTAKQRWGYRGRNTIDITHNSDFYDDLLPGKDLHSSVATNVEYVIDTKLLTVTKKVRS